MLARADQIEPGCVDCLNLPGFLELSRQPQYAWTTIFHAAVEQTWIHDICDQTTNSPCSVHVLEWVATVTHYDCETTVNEMLARQSRQMLLKAMPRSICLDFVDIHYPGHQRSPTELCHTTPTMAPASTIATAPRSSSLRASRSSSRSPGCTVTKP